jgi:hypothetical protein
MRRAALTAASTALLSACGWNSYPLHHPINNAEATCVAPWGPLSSEESQRLWGCIEACEAQGFLLERPEDVPARPMIVPGAQPFWIPLACQ